MQDVIMAMLSNKALLRPTMRAVAEHVSLFAVSKRIHFLQEVSDLWEKASATVHNSVKNRQICQPPCNISTFSLEQIL